MYGIYANIWGILMVNVTIYIAYMDPMGYWDVRYLGISGMFQIRPSLSSRISRTLITWKGLVMLSVPFRDRASFERRERTRKSLCFLGNGA